MTGRAVCIALVSILGSANKSLADRPSVPQERKPKHEPQPVVVDGGDISVVKDGYRRCEPFSEEHISGDGKTLAERVETAMLYRIAGRAVDVDWGREVRVLLERGDVFLIADHVNSVPGFLLTRLRLIGNINEVRKYAVAHSKRVHYVRMDARVLRGNDGQFAIDLRVAIDSISPKSAANDNADSLSLSSGACVIPEGKKLRFFDATTAIHG